MSTIFDCKQKLSSLVKNTISAFEQYSNQEILAIENIINIMFSHSYNGNVIDSQLFSQLNKIITKYNLKIVKNKIQFKKASTTSHYFYYAKMYCDFLNKIISYLNKFVTQPQKFSDVINAVNNQKLAKLVIIKSEMTEQNELLIADNSNVMLKEYILDDHNFSDINNINFEEGELKNIDSFRTKTIVGNKHMQIMQSDATTLVDVQDGKNIIKDIEEFTITQKTNNI